MDPNALAGMIFTLILTLLVGGFIILFPITRRLGQALEVWIAEHRRSGTLPPETATILSRLDDITIRLSEIEEQNTFLERLVRDDPAALKGQMRRTLAAGQGGEPRDEKTD